MNYIKYKKIVIDFTLNIISVGIPSMVIQFVMLPSINYYSENDYGLIITYISLFSVISLPFGTCLNNTRLLKNKDYVTIECTGDFNIYYVLSIIANSIFLCIGYFLISDGGSIQGAVAILVIAILNIGKEYLVVFFRLDLNYFAILIGSIFLTFGYFVGYCLYRMTLNWEYIYLLGYTFQFIFLLIKTKAYKEKFTKTSLFTKNILIAIALLIASFLGTLPSYVDKLMLYPILGDNVVAVYYASTIFAKMIAQVIAPINGVILSYLVRKNELDKKMLLRYIAVVLAFCVVGYFICILISRPLLYYLYPNLAESALKYVPIATISAIIGMIFSVINPLVIRFKNMNWQIVVHGSNAIIYFICTLSFLDLFGLKGFYCGICLCNIVKVIFIIFLLTRSLCKDSDTTT